MFFCNVGVAIHLCNFERYLIPLNILYNNIIASEMKFIKINQKNKE